MSIDLSKIGYGAVLGPASSDGILLSKIGYGVIASTATVDGIHVSKIGYGVIVGPDSLTTIKPALVDDEPLAYAISSSLPVSLPLFVDDRAGVYEPWIIANFTIQDRERNPFPAHIPFAPDVKELGEFHSVQQRVIRDQHNKTQAGDTTFDYGLLLKGTPNRLYTLGSLGRLYHERFGVILARYVQFRGCVGTPRQGTPVGYFRTSDRVDWIVTNDFSKSGADLTVGVMCLAETPEDDTYGWVVTEGPVPVVMSQVGGIIPAPETPYSWFDTGSVGIGVSGKVLGRRWGAAASPALAGGTLFIRLEGISPASIVDLINEELVPVNATLANHETRLDTVEPFVTDLQLGAAQFTQDLTALGQRVTTEEQARIRDIASVRSLITGGEDWGAEIVAGDNVVRAEFQAADSALMVLVDQAQHRADEAYARTGGDFAGLEAAVLGLNSAVSNISARFSSVSFDTTTVAPTNRQVLGFISADGLWKPITLTAAEIIFTPAGAIVATNVQAAIQELDAKKVALAGLAGGQTINGGTAASENLTLRSTAHATKGKILLGTSSAYDETTERLGIGTASPNANAALDVSSTTKAFMPPRMTTTQKNAIPSPAAGMVVYDSTLAKLCVYTGAAWETITSV